MKISSGFIGERYVAIPLSVEETLSADPLYNGLYVFSIGHFPQALYHHISRPNGCNEHILLYCTSGEGIVQIGDAEFSLKADDFIVIPAHSPHAYWSCESDPWSIYWIHFKGTNAQQLSRDLSFPHTLTASVTSRMDERIALFDEIYSSLNGATTADYFIYASLLFGHFMATFKFLDIYRSVKVPTNKSATTHSDTIVREAIHYMNEHLETHMTMDELAELCQYSKSHLHRKFVKEVGMAPMDYFIHRKIDRACLLLTHTTLSVNQIAYKLAFSESQYFARTFKKIMGMPATEYRKSKKQG